MKTWTMPLLAAAALSACGSPQVETAEVDGNGVPLRNLATTNVAAPAPPPEQMRVRGRLIPTPSDTSSRYFLLRERTALTGTTIAILRQERAGRVAYARTEVDCTRRLFHVLGVAGNRALVETEQAYDGPLRPIEGLPLRQELAGFVCEQAGTPLSAT